MIIIARDWARNQTLRGSRSNAGDLGPLLGCHLHDADVSCPTLGNRRKVARGAQRLDEKLVLNTATKEMSLRILLDDIFGSTEMRHEATLPPGAALSVRIQPD